MSCRDQLAEASAVLGWLTLIAQAAVVGRHWWRHRP